MRAVIVVGLPGSGKSFLLHQLKSDAEARGQTVAWLDDPRTPGQLEAFLSEVTRAQPDLVVIADPSLCDDVVRYKADGLLSTRFGSAEIHWTYFANDASQCLLNTANREDGRNVRVDILTWTKRYNIPEGAEVLPVWRPDAVLN
jgi:GTPase SAR1 family protein